MIRFIASFLTGVLSGERLSADDSRSAKHAFQRSRKRFDRKEKISQDCRLAPRVPDNIALVA
jgi:hypothetical protein